MKPKLAYAIVSKKRPSINLNEIYSKEQIKDCYVDKHEMVIEVVISERVESVFDKQMRVSNMMANAYTGLVDTEFQKLNKINVSRHKKVFNKHVLPNLKNQINIKKK